MNRKRGRENPCSVCGHYHNYEEGEVCATCGHRLQVPTEKSQGHHQSAFSSEVLPGFLYLGSYDNASRAEIMKAQGIRRILNTVPACQNLYKNSFAYHCVNGLPFDECFEFLEKARLEQARVLVHCMSGLSRSPAVVIAYLMRHKGWRLKESHEYVKSCKQSINIAADVWQRLQEYEVALFGNQGLLAAPPSFPQFAAQPVVFPQPAATFDFAAQVSNGFVFGQDQRSMDS